MINLGCLYSIYVVPLFWNKIHSKKKKNNKKNKALQKEKNK